LQIKEADILGWSIYKILFACSPTTPKCKGKNAHHIPFPVIGGLSPPCFHWTQKKNAAHFFHVTGGYQQLFSWSNRRVNH
jgi:hypothetical protein